MLTWKQFGCILGIFLVWRIVLFAVAYQAERTFTYVPSFPYWDSRVLIEPIPTWVSKWGSFDGVHYITIADRGYLSAANIQAFFPIFPLLMSLIYYSTNLTLISSGLILSNISAIGLLVTFFVYIKERFNEKIAWKSLAVLITFPTAFFHVAVYSESFFLMLVILAFWCSRNRWWFAAGLVTVIATATRVVGVFLIVALLIDLFFQQYQITRKTSLSEIRHKVLGLLRRNWISIVWIFAGLSGIGVYMYFLWLNYHDPLYFFSVQSSFGAGRSKDLVIFPQVVWRHIRILLTVPPATWRYYSFVQDFVISIGVLGLLVIGLLHRKLKAKISELTFSFLAFLLPPLTGSLSSMPRYVLVCFPMYFLIPLIIKKRWLFAVYLLGSTLLLVLNVMLFIQGYWVA